MTVTALQASEVVTEVRSKFSPNRNISFPYFICSMDTFLPQSGRTVRHSEIRQLFFIHCTVALVVYSAKGEVVRPNSCSSPIRMPLVLFSRSETFAVKLRQRFDVRMNSSKSFVGVHFPQAKQGGGKLSSGSASTRD